MRVLDRFSGIGGFSLGLERAGFKTVAFCEIDPYCRAVLAARWPGVPIFGDIREFAGVPCDVIAGGFPCQDISLAGKGAGLAGERSGLWREYHRLIRELRPRYVIVENVSALLGRGLGEVLGDLASIGYDAEWHCIPAAYVGAPHRRDRVWIIAYPNRRGCELERQPEHGEQQGASGDQSHGLREWRRRSGPPVPDAGCELLEGWVREPAPGATQWLAQSDVGRVVDGISAELDLRPWLQEPNIPRVAQGVVNRVDRLKSLGNAIVPQILEMIGRAIMELEGRA